MLTEAVRSKLRSRVDEYVSRVPSMEIDPDEPAAVVRAPVEAGVSKFIDVDGLPDLDSLPFIPERMRDFAFRYATEYMTVAKWAKEYNCSVHTIEKWMRHEGVRAYIALCRYEQRMYNLAQHVTMQRNVYRAINRILNAKLTGDSIGPIVSLTKFVYEILHDPQGAHSRAKGAFNVNIGFGKSDVGDASDSPYNVGGNPYRLPEKDVTPKQIEAIKADIAELEILSKALGENGDGEDS